MLLDRPVVFSLLFPPIPVSNPSLHRCMSHLRVATPPLIPCYLLVHAVLCSALPSQLIYLQPVRFPQEALMFTSDVCIFPVVERLPSPSVYPVLSISCGLHSVSSGTQPVRKGIQDHLGFLFPVPRSTAAISLTRAPALSHCLVLDSKTHLVPPTNPPTSLSLSWNVRFTRHIHQPRSLHISHHMPTVAVTSFLSHFSYRLVLS